MGMGYAALIVYLIFAIVGLALARIIYVADARAKNEQKGMDIER